MPEKQARESSIPTVICLVRSLRSKKSEDLAVNLLILNERAESIP